MTALEIRVLEVIGGRRDWRERHQPGDVVTAHVLGGTFGFEVTPEEAKITGFRPDLSDEEEQAVIDAGEVPEDGGADQIPDEPFKVSLTTGYWVSLTEGDEIIAFIRDHQLWDPVANDGTRLDAQLTFPVHPVGHGIFVRDDDSVAFKDATSDARFDEDSLRSEAARLDGLLGEPPIADMMTAVRIDQPAG
ncbi:MAG: hypothetical protein AAF467_27960 [Actinomycetota bacterium]